jgi:hypothetical protein
MRSKKLCLRAFKPNKANQLGRNTRSRSHFAGYLQRSTLRKYKETGMNEIVHKTPEEYGPAFQEHLLEQYKIARSRVVDIINDRNTQNKFLLAVLERRGQVLQSSNRA